MQTMHYDAVHRVLLYDTKEHLVKVHRHVPKEIKRDQKLPDRAFVRNLHVYKRILRRLVECFLFSSHA